MCGGGGEVRVCVVGEGRGGCIVCPGDCGVLCYGGVEASISNIGSGSLSI